MSEASNASAAQGRENFVVLEPRVRYRARHEIRPAFLPQHPEVALVVRGFNRVENGEVLTDSFITAEGVRREFEKVRNALNRAESRALKAVFDEEVVKRMDERYKIG